MTWPTKESGWAFSRHELMTHLKCNKHEFPWSVTGVDAPLLAPAYITMVRILAKNGFVIQEHTPYFLEHSIAFYREAIKQEASGFYWNAVCRAERESANYSNADAVVHVLCDELETEMWLFEMYKKDFTLSHGWFDDGIPIVPSRNQDDSYGG